MLGGGVLSLMVKLLGALGALALLVAAEEVLAQEDGSANFEPRALRATALLLLALRFVVCARARARACVCVGGRGEAVRRCCGNSAG